MDEKDRFGETMRLVERAREDIYFTQRDRELIEKLRARLQKVEEAEPELTCPRCRRKLETYSFMGILMDRCPACGGIWMDQGELETVLKVASRGSLSSLIHRFLSKGEAAIKKEVVNK
ncbi:MAG TPA: zf-TFIIB domain-containing protein [Candidatus Binatia bacterium]|nr:zf-TFIIB domain-containing protein [Candidatus Binatia bacterium]